MAVADAEVGLGLDGIPQLRQGGAGGDLGGAFVDFNLHNVKKPLDESGLGREIALSVGAASLRRYNPDQVQRVILLPGLSVVHSPRALQIVLRTLTEAQSRVNGFPVEGFRCFPGGI
jgi:hypothetical protein